MPRLERFDHNQNDDREQYHNRDLVEPPIEHVAAAILTTREAFDLSAAHVVIADQQHHQCQFSVQPGLGHEPRCEDHQPDTENQCRYHRRAHDAPVKFALHDAKTITADCVLAHRVVNEQTGQVEEGCKPADHRDNV